MAARACCQARNVWAVCGYSCMLTLTEFTSEWKRLHHPSMSVDDDVAFFYGVYVRLHHLTEMNAHDFDEQLILSLLVYTENAIAVGIDGVYQYRYRCVGDVVFNWCDSLYMGADATSQVDRLVTEAVAKAPGSALRQWMAVSVLSGDFLRLGVMLTWFAREDRILRQVLPDLRFRKAMFMRLAGNEHTAQQMLWADVAFNWRDKLGDSLADTIAKQFRYETSFVEAEEKALLKEAAEILDAIRTERLDTYTVIEKKDKRTFTLRHSDGRVFSDVTFPTPVQENAQGRCLAAQLVTYNNKTYINGPIAWLTDKAMHVWDGENVWNDIVKKEQDAAKLTYFTTTFGKRLSLYEDLYTVPEDPEEAYYADMGIYLDEPNIFDFLSGRPNGKVINSGG